jgi:hypothetical protein
MKFYFNPTRPQQNHRDKSFTRSFTAFTLEDPKEPARPAFLNLSIRMTYMNQGVNLIKAAIEEKVGKSIELAGAYPFKPL